MAHRYPDDRERWERGYGSGDYSRDRGAAVSAREDREPWSGSGFDAHERGGPTSAWGNPRSYSSEREYGDRAYARRAPESRNAGDYLPTPGSSNPDRPHGDGGWRERPSMPAYAGIGHGHYAEPGHLGPGEYGSQQYGSPYGRGRSGTREWSSVEGWRVPGPHVGRGPRGYQRADERIQDELHERLTAHGLIDPTDIECRVVNGEVTLTGIVDSRAAKRAAEDLAEDIYGVRQVRNELRIQSPAHEQGVGRTSVLGLTEAQLQRAPAADTERPRTRS